MKIFRDIDKVSIKNPVATIGIFDGVHKAHQAIIQQLQAKAKEVSGESVIITLWPHPRVVLDPGNNSIQLINTLEEKISKLKESGVENLIILPFDKKLAATGFDTFVKDYLVDKLQIHHLVVGFNHHFGNKREGNFERLQVLANEIGFDLSRVEPYIIHGDKVSSSEIRKLLVEGEIRKASEFLGYPFFVAGKVIPGKKLGRSIGFPTANLSVTDSHKIIPKNGVYAVDAEVEGTSYLGMMNIGCRPTVDSECLQSTLEVNLFDFNNDLYQKELTVNFYARIRDEKKFNNLTELSEQISRDRDLIRQVLIKLKK
jgi:riboflavin kinase / FMN adenylyltransferase